MTRNERLFKKEYASELLGVAEGDLKTAELLFKNLEEVRKENLIFHLQQATEKALKAVLCYQGHPIPFTHDMEALLVHLGSQTPPHAEVLPELTPFATVRRYEEGNDIITEEDIRLAFVCAIEVCKWARGKIAAKT